MSNPDRTRRLLMQATAASAAIPAPGLSLAESFPARPIRLICPWPPGGSTDAVMRVVAESAGKALGGQMIVENKSGASGMLGPIELLTAKPDGYTLSQTTIGLVRLPHMQKMPFDPLKDFTYIARLTNYTFGLVVRSDSPISTIQDLVSYAKANPGKFTFGSTGVGTSQHLAIEDFSFKAGINLLHVPFKGFSDAIPALMGGHIMAHSDSSGWGAQVDAGTLRLLATYGASRTKRWPSIPTLLELGYSAVWDSPFGIGGPRGMDPSIIRQLHDALRKTLDDPVVLATFEKFDQSTAYLNTEDYARFQREQFARERALIERLGLSLKT